MIDAAIYVFAVVIATIVGYVLPISRKLDKTTERFQSFLLFALIIMLGINIGFDPNIENVIGSLGIKSLIIALAASAGSVFVLFVFQKYYYQDSRRRIDIYDEEDTEDEKPKSMNISAIIILALLLGFFLTRVFVNSNIMLWAKASINSIIRVLLVLMITCSGLSIGQNKSFLREFKMNWIVLVCVPIGIMIGSILGGALVAALSGQSILEYSAASAGCTWYSVAGVMLSEFSPELGLMALLVNMIREILALCFTPICAEKLGPLPSIGVSGAASMDVLHSVLVTSNGKGIAVIAFANGLILTIFVPVVLRAFLIILN